MLCEPLDARRALEWGLVNRVVAEAELDALVDDWARRLAAKPETAMQVTGSQFRAYAAAALAGEVSEADGDWLLLGSGSAEARERFRR